MNKPEKKLLFVVNDLGFFLSHRLPIARQALQTGWEVHVAAPQSPQASTLKAEGLEFQPIRLSRSGKSLVAEWITLWDLYRLYRNLRPDVVHHVTIKPVLYGGAVARWLRVSGVVNAVTGLGYVFISRGMGSAVLRAVVRPLYRYSLANKHSRTIFQNPDDLKLFVQKRLIHPAQALMIKGSGVDMKAFAPKKEAAGPPLVVLASRMLWDKGVGEFIQAAQRLQKQGIQARFALVGDPDPGNPSSVTADQLKQWAADGIVEWWGRREDMAQVFHQAHIVCLPSYREGLPKVLIEAAACGKPIVASDMPGCREVVWDGQNGLLVPVKNALALADALETLIGDTPLRERMGQAGRAIALEEFPVEKVVALTLALYQGLLPPKI